jgi:hypothetical protein
MVLLIKLIMEQMETLLLKEVRPTLLNKYVKYNKYLQMVIKTQVSHLLSHRIMKRKKMARTRRN